MDFLRVSFALQLQLIRLGLLQATSKLYEDCDPKRLTIKATIEAQKERKDDQMGKLGRLGRMRLLCSPSDDVFTGEVLAENVAETKVNAYLLANIRVGAIEELFNVRSQVASQFSASNVSNRSKSQTNDVLVNVVQVAVQIEIVKWG